MNSKKNGSVSYRLWMNESGFFLQKKPTHQEKDVQATTFVTRYSVMPSAGVEPTFQASEACVLSIAPRGRSV